MNGYIMGNKQPSVLHAYERIRDLGALSYATQMTAEKDLPYPHHGWLKITFTERRKR